MKRIHLKLAAVLAATLGIAAFAGEASAACRSKFVAVNAVDGATGKVELTTDGKRCLLHFASQKQTRITESKISAAPKNGSVNHTRLYGLEYTAKAGFKGEDAFAIRVCAKTGDKTGCSVISYAVTVK